MEVTRKQLDSSQYTAPSIRQYELVYGEDFVAPGGRLMAAELIERMALPAGSRVLDAGCGLGGSAFVMARDFELLVDGIDLSSNMIFMAEEKLQKHHLESKVTLRQGDCMKLNAANKYDAVYSRDVFLHIHDKKRLFARLHGSLKARGKLLFTDYCCGATPWQSEFTRYVEDRGYCLHTLEAYADLIGEAGFSDITYEDLTTRFIEILRQEMQKIETLNIDRSARSDLAAGWIAKIHRAETGDQKWGLFTAKK